MFQILSGFNHALKWYKNAGRFVILKNFAYISTYMDW